MVILTKSDIINGKEERKEIYIPLLKKEISLRPLTDGEYNRFIAMSKDLGPVQADINESMEKVDINKAAESAEKKRSMSMNMDLKKQEEARFRAECTVAAFGLSNDNEKWMPRDLENMRPIGVVRQIADAVIKISGVDDPEKLEEDVKEFRE